MSYSQGDEERVILKAVEGIERGYVVDIGAHDGITYSNSRALMERGWRGLLIEPSPAAFLKLLALYGQNENATLLNGAVGWENHLVRFYDCGGDFYGTTRKDKMSKDVAYQSFWVPSVTPEMILNQFDGAPDVLSVDTEGTSFEIVKKLDELWFTQLKVICVEHDGRSVEIATWGHSRDCDVGYLDPQNICLVRRK